MAYKMEFSLRSEDEDVKDAGLVIDFDEIARRGVMSKAEKTIAKWYGIYASRQPGNHMARVVTPGGVMTSSQARNIASISEHYGQGILNITTRQAIQFHWLKLGNLADMLRGLADEGSTTQHGCGDVARSIPACPLAETCQFARINVLPWAQKLQKYLGDSRDLDNLPRKFKFTFSGCSGGCAQPYINCVGVVAVQRGTGDQKQVGFQVIVGGGLGWDPYMGQELFSFIPEDRILDVGRALALTFRDHGDRFNRATSRMKFVVQREGIDKVREYVLGFLKAEGKSIEGLETAPIVETGKPVPDRPLNLPQPPARDGTVAVDILVPKGELSYDKFAAVADLAEAYGDQRVRTTNRQNLSIHGVSPKRADALKKEIQTLGFATEGFYGLKDIVPCVGTTYCPKAVAETRRLHDLLVPVVSQDKYKGIEQSALINIAGCPNSCSPWRIADLGFRGMRIREDQGSVEGFEMRIGGSPTRLGQYLGEFKVTDIPVIVETVLDTFLQVKQQQETLQACVARVGVEPFSKAVFA